MHQVDVRRKVEDSEAVRWLGMPNWGQPIGEQHLRRDFRHHARLRMFVFFPNLENACVLLQARSVADWNSWVHQQTSQPLSPLIAVVNDPSRDGQVLASMETGCVEQRAT